MIVLELAVAAAVVAVLLLVCAGIFAAALHRITVERRARTASSEISTLIREAIVQYIAGNRQETRIREFAQSCRREIGDVLMEFQGAICGSALDQLGDLALEIALVHDWCADLKSRDAEVRRAACERLAFVCAYEPCRRVAGDHLLNVLDDPDAGVRLQGARVLAMSDEPAVILRIFKLAIHGSLLTRILLAEDLRRHASFLCDRAIPEALRSSESLEVLGTFEILCGWERALPLPELAPMFDHPNRQIRIAALRLAPFVALTDSCRAGIVRALSESDDQVGTVAALTAGRLKLQPALAPLARLVRTGTADIARAAANALAEMPPRGWQTLEEFAGGVNPSAAFIATEALERAQRRVEI